MKIGGYYIKGLSRRFWAVLLLGAFVLFMIFYLLGRGGSGESGWQSGELTAASLDQGFSLQDLSRDYSEQNSGAPDPGTTLLELSGCSDSAPRCVNSPEGSGGAVLEYLQEANIGYAFRFRAFVPGANTEIQAGDGTSAILNSSKGRGSLFSSQEQWNFFPAALLEDGSSLTSSDLASREDAGALAARVAQSMIIGEGGVVPPGAIQLGVLGALPDEGLYDFDAVLYSSSNAIQKPTSEQYLAQPLPTLLVVNYKKISSQEILRPTQELAEMQYTYASGKRYQLSLQSLEWAQGEARLCLRLANNSLRSVPVWRGLDAIRLRVNGTTITGQAQAPLDSDDDLSLGGDISGYISFVSDQSQSLGGSPAQQDIALEIPSLRSTDPQGSFQTRISLGQGRDAIDFRSITEQAAEKKVAPLGSGGLCSAA